MKNLNLFTTTAKHVDNAYAEHMLDFLYPFNLETGKDIACSGRFNMVKLGRNKGYVT